MTVFYELAGEAARQQLGTLANTLERAGARTELLESATEPGLFLLVCRSTSALTVAAPEGCRVWTFDEVAR